MGGSCSIEGCIQTGGSTAVVAPQPKKEDAFQNCLKNDAEVVIPGDEISVPEPGLLEEVNQRRFRLENVKYSLNTKLPGVVFHSVLLGVLNCILGTIQLWCMEVILIYCIFFLHTMTFPLGRYFSDSDICCVLHKIIIFIQLP